MTNLYSGAFKYIFVVTIKWRLRESHGHKLHSIQWNAIWRCFGFVGNNLDFVTPLFPTISLNCISGCWISVNHQYKIKTTAKKIAAALSASLDYLLKWVVVRIYPRPFSTGFPFDECKMLRVPLLCTYLFHIMRQQKLTKQTLKDLARQQINEYLIYRISNRNDYLRIGIKYLHIAALIKKNNKPTKKSCSWQNEKYEKPFHKTWATVTCNTRF